MNWCGNRIWQHRGRYWEWSQRDKEAGAAAVAVEERDVFVIVAVVFVVESDDNDDVDKGLKRTTVNGVGAAADIALAEGWDTSMMMAAVLVVVENGFNDDDGEGGDDDIKGGTGVAAATASVGERDPSKPDDKEKNGGSKDEGRNSEYRCSSPRWRVQNE
ncbi:hypothetical protein BGX29_010814 [Mortierella sp. GBA35]|nr:hypothetical protein BGX29_010814 [Mortierella sp. GBA35]